MIPIQQHCIYSKLFIQGISEVYSTKAQNILTNNSNNDNHNSSNSNSNSNSNNNNNNNNKKQFSKHLRIQRKVAY